MTTPIVICDDSSFARKQMARALPQGWDVEVTLAANGHEALEAVRAGKGDVLFLDLTMPDLDGFGVLEIIRREDLPTLVIVVSGDIQAESQRRVKQLGAIAFLKKPVDAAELSKVLEDYGVLGVLTAATPMVEDKVEFADWCQEVANVAMGRTADLLARLITDHVDLPIPRVRQLSLGEVNQRVVLREAGHTASCVSQGFIGNAIAGEMLVVFHDIDAAELARLLRYETHEELASEPDLMMEIANVLIGAFLHAFSALLDVKFSLGQPALTAPDHESGSLIQRKEAAAEKVLAIEIAYVLGERKLRCTQWMLVKDGSVAALQDRAQLALG